MNIKEQRVKFMKKIPDKINILGRQFTISVRNRDHDGTGELASARYATQEIWIDSEAHIQVQEESLIHEIIEMLNTMCELNLQHEKISVLGTTLHQVLIDNKLLFGYIENDTVRGKELEN